MHQIIDVFAHAVYHHHFDAQAAQQGNVLCQCVELFGGNDVTADGQNNGFVAQIMNIGRCLAERPYKRIKFCVFGHGVSNKK